MNNMDIKDEICFKDEPLEDSPDDVPSSILSTHSDHQALGLKQGDSLQVSSYGFIVYCNLLFILCMKCVAPS